MAKISLCMIVGNVEEYIRRCLESFLPICDEVCMVRAIGNQAADNTLAIAQATCVAAGKLLQDGGLLQCGGAQGLAACG
jgi:Fe-S-cluster-containing hydrogenase component 2